MRYQLKSMYLYKSKNKTSLVNAAVFTSTFRERLNSDQLPLEYIQSQCSDFFLAVKQYKRQTITGKPQEAASPQVTGQKTTDVTQNEIFYMLRTGTDVHLAVDELFMQL